MFNNQIYANNLQNDEDYNKLLDDILKVDYTAFYRGIVVDNYDPLGLGRVKVRVPQIYGAEDQKNTNLYVPTYSIPYATSAVMVGAGNNTGAFLIPNIGDIVFITFENGDAKLPIYFGGILSTNNTDNRFLGTGDVNRGKLYTDISEDDFNTDIENKAQRVIYKSLKGATIIINDKDGEESIKIIDQLGQFISLENISSEPLNRDRSGGVETKDKSGRIVIKDAYGDSIDLVNGEIHIKTPKLTIETDDYNIVGLNDNYEEQVDLALEILDEDREG